MLNIIRMFVSNQKIYTMFRLLVILLFVLPLGSVQAQQVKQDVAVTDSAWAVLFECSARDVSSEELTVVLNWITESDTSFTTTVNDWESIFFMNTNNKNKVLVCKMHPTKTMKYELLIYTEE